MDYIFIDKEISKLRAELSGVNSEFKNRLLDQCDRYFDTELAEVHPKTSTTYMGIAAANLALGYLVSEDEKYLTEAKRWIFTCVKYEHWGNAHLVDVDLSAAWILFGLGLSYNWLNEDLTPSEKQLLKDKLILQAGRMYDFKQQTIGEGWSTNYWQNHNWINHTGLAACGYALKDEYPEAQAWIDDAKANFEVVFDVMADDGSDYEGVVYWRYGAMWLFIYAHLLKEREGINYFKSCGFLKETFFYRLYQSAPNLEEQINFGDCHDRRSGHSTAIYYKVASEYKNGHAQKLANLVRKEFLHREQSLSQVKPGIYPEALFEAIFYDNTVEEEDFETLPLVKYFDDLGLLVIRSSWEKDALHFSFKCSYPGGKKQWEKLWDFKLNKNYNCFGLSHQHPDNNSFILLANNKYLAIDEGYNRSVKASDHNVILVDGKGYVDEGQNNIWKNYSQDMVGKVESVTIDDDFVEITGETSLTYQKDLKLSRNARSVFYSKLGYFVMLDDIRSEEEHHYTWLMNSDYQPKVTSRKVKYEDREQEVLVFDYVTDKVDFKVINLNDDIDYCLGENYVKAVMTTQEPDKFRDITMQTLKISNRNTSKNQWFLNVLEVNKEFDEITKIDNETSIGVTVTIDGKKETYLRAKDNVINYLGKEYHEKTLYINHLGNVRTL